LEVIVADHKALVSKLVHPLFLFLDVMGIASCFAIGFVRPTWHPFFITLGSALLTTGITLPVAVFFQSIHNEQAFKILNSCTRAGIESVFVSRKQDSSDLYVAMRKALSDSTTISLLGVAFKTFFDPSGEAREALSWALNLPAKTLKVLLLDPKCQAARLREKAEHGNSTIDDIEKAISTGLLAVFLERMIRLRKEIGEVEFDRMVADFVRMVHLDTAGLRQRLNMQVRTYTSEPVAQIIMFDGSLFGEQYHRGRPNEIVPLMSCIGKYMPVIQFRRGSYSYRFLECHFVTIWSEAQDITDKLISDALRKLPALLLMLEC